MNKLTQLCLFLLLVGCNSKTKSKKFEVSEPLPKHVIGFYEYQASGAQRNQYILIDTLNNNTYGIFYRTEARHGKGQWYYANSLTELKIKNNNISFELGNRKMFSSRPVSPGQRSMNIPDDSSKKETNSLKFTGRYTILGLELQCISSTGDCPGSSMVFKRIPLPD